MAAEARAVIFTSVKNGSRKVDPIAATELDRQDANCRKRARRFGLPVHSVFREIGVNPYTPLAERPVLLEALDLMTARDHLVVASPKVISYRVSDFLVVVSRIIRVRGELVCVAEQTETADEIRAAVGEVVLATMQTYPH